MMPGGACAGQADPKPFIVCLASYVQLAVRALSETVNPECS